MKIRVTRFGGKPGISVSDIDVATMQEDFFECSSEDEAFRLKRLIEKFSSQLVQRYIQNQPGDAAWRKQMEVLSR